MVVFNFNKSNDRFIINLQSVGLYLVTISVDEKDVDERLYF